MFNISRMLSIYFGENLFYFSTNPTVKALRLCLPVQSGATQCSSSAAAARPLHRLHFPKNCKFEMLLTFHLYSSPTSPSTTENLHL